MLVVDQPEVGAPDPDDWIDDEGEPVVDIDLEYWAVQDEEILRIRAAEGFEIVPRWITINGERGFVLRGPEFAAVGLTDESESEGDFPPAITNELLSWGFYSESGGPCIWAGGAQLGWCGARLWAFKQWGDIDPDTVVAPAVDEADKPEELAGWIRAQDWELPYLLEAVGLPGLTEDDQNALWAAGDVEGPYVSSALDHELDLSVVERLCSHRPALREAVDGLQNPDSQRGRLIYTWLRQIAYGDYQSGSWNQVQAAMLGSIDPPADDQRASAIADAWDADMPRAGAAITETMRSQDDEPSAASDSAHEFVPQSELNFYPEGP